jgi:hypothetical protein
VCLTHCLERGDYDSGMDLFADISEGSILDLIAVLLLMAIWGSAIVALDHLVWSGHSDWPGRRVEVPKGKPGNG